MSEKLLVEQVEYRGTINGTELTQGYRDLDQAANDIVGQIEREAYWQGNTYPLEEVIGEAAVSTVVREMELPNYFV